MLGILWQINGMIYFLPVTLVKLDMHSNFACPVAITFEMIEKLQPATIEKVEEKWNSTNLTVKRIIQN